MFHELLGSLLIFLLHPTLRIMTSRSKGEGLQNKFIGKCSMDIISQIFKIAEFNFYINFDATVVIGEDEIENFEKHSIYIMLWFFDLLSSL